MKKIPLLFLNQNNEEYFLNKKREKARTEFSRVRWEWVLSHHKAPMHGLVPHFLQNRCHLLAEVFSVLCQHSSLAHLWVLPALTVASFSSICSYHELSFQRMGVGGWGVVLFTETSPVWRTTHTLGIQQQIICQMNQCQKCSTWRRKSDLRVSRNYCIYTLGAVERAILAHRSINHAVTKCSPSSASANRKVHFQCKVVYVFFNFTIETDGLMSDSVFMKQCRWFHCLIFVASPSSTMLYSWKCSNRTSFDSSWQGCP